MAHSETLPTYYLDKAWGVLLDISGDGGDSAHFTGLYVMSTGNHVGMHKFVKLGFGRRHPEQYPWTNVRNFSRDQLMPLLAGLHTEKKSVIAKQVFKQHAKRLFFAQNFERDEPGTTKYPWPHKVKGKWRILDFADPLAPHHIYAMAKAANINLPWLYPIAVITLILELLTFKYGDNNDQGAIISTAYLMNRLDLFKKYNPNWKAKLENYCMGWRKQSRLYQSLTEFIERAR